MTFFKNNKIYIIIINKIYNKKVIKNNSNK